MRESEGTCNQRLLLRHRRVREWKDAIAIRRPRCGGDIDLLFVIPGRPLVLFVVEALLGHKRDSIKKDLEQLSRYAKSIRRATCRGLAAAFRRAFSTKLGGAQNREHVRRHRDEFVRGFFDLLIVNPHRPWQVVPVIVCHGDTDKARRTLLNLTAKGLRKIGLIDLRILRTKTRGKRVAPHLISWRDFCKPGSRD